MMRTDEVVSLSIWLAKVGRLTSTEKIKSDTAIERIVRIFLRLLRSRFLKISVRYFIIFPCSGYAEIWSKEIRSEEHTSELQSLTNLVCRLLLEKKKIHHNTTLRTSN